MNKRALETKKSSMIEEVVREEASAIPVQE